MSNPFISICIPTYKNVDYLQRLLQSIFIQTFREYEIVITDNSPDTSVEELVKKWSEQFPIRYYKNNPPTNMGENFNIVLQKGKGEWLKMMHDDDWFSSPDSLQKFAGAASKTSKKFIFSASNNISSPSGKERSEYLTKSKKEMLEENPLNLFYLNVIGHPSTVMHKKDERILYDPQFSWVVDVDFYIRYLMKHTGFEYIPEPLINIGNDENQMSNKYHKNPRVEIPEYFKLLNKHPVNLAKNIYVFHAFWLLVRKFKIKDFNQIREAGYTGIIPDEITAIIKCQKNIPRIILKQTPQSNYFMKRCFKKINSRLV
jgi:glycosyltransferase involved in cell wall biosynthesis